MRLPLIPGHNDVPEMVRKTGAFLEKARQGVSVEVLPYHRLGAPKYEHLGRPYALSEVKTPDDARLEAVADSLSGFDLDLKLGRGHQTGEQIQV